MTEDKKQHTKISFEAIRTKLMNNTDDYAVLTAEDIRYSSDHVTTLSDDYYTTMRDRVNTAVSGREKFRADLAEAAGLTGHPLESTVWAQAVSMSQARRAHTLVDMQRHAVEAYEVLSGVAVAFMGSEPALRAGTGPASLQSAFEYGWMQNAALYRPACDLEGITKDQLTKAMAADWHTCTEGLKGLITEFIPQFCEGDRVTCSNRANRLGIVKHVSGHDGEVVVQWDNGPSIRYSPNAPSYNMLQFADAPGDNEEPVQATEASTKSSTKQHPLLAHLQDALDLVAMLPDDDLADDVEHMISRVIDRISAPLITGKKKCKGCISDCDE